MGEIVLITGASSGIGKATAKLMKKEGYRVYGTARRVEEMNDLVDQGIKVFHLDLTVDRSIVDCIDAIIQKEGRIDILINNAGRADFGIANGLGGSIPTISGNGPYKKSAKKVAVALDAVFSAASSPDVIAKTISKAIKARDPKTRYSAGYRAKSFLFSKKFLPDKIFDKMLMREFM